MMMCVPILAAAATTISASAAETPVPLYTGWISGFLLPIVWLFVGAVVIGPLVYHFKLEPRSTQLFVDDKRGTHGH